MHCWSAQMTIKRIKMELSASTVAEFNNNNNNESPSEHLELAFQGTELLPSNLL